MFNRHFIIRELAASTQQSIIFILCVALSMVTLVSLSWFGDGVDRAVTRDAKALHAADIIIESNYDLSPPLLESINRLKDKGAIEAARVYEFYSVVRNVEREGSLLADIKVVEKGYPFYGTVELASGKPFRDRLVKGSVVVAQTVPERLKIAVGDRVRIGNATLTVGDVVVREPDRPVSVFSLGPRIFVPAEDLEGLDLVKKGSRVRFKALVRVLDDREVESVAALLRASSDRSQERVETFRTAESGVKRFFDNFLFFLNLIGIFTLLLAGTGIQSALTSFLREREKTIAIIKAVGGTRRFITLHFSVIAAILGTVGTALGVAASLLLLRLLPPIFGEIIPGSIVYSVSWAALVQGLALGTAVVYLFTFLPLYRLEGIRPASILGREETRVRKGAAVYLSLAATTLFSVGMAAWRIRDVKTGTYFVAGIAALLVLSFLATELSVLVLKKIKVRSLALRQAARGLLRPGNATAATIMTLTASLTVISSIYLVEKNLDADFVRSYPEDASNLFFLDIQTSQKEEFSTALGMKAEYYPVVRGRISSINGMPVNVREELKKTRDNLGREFNLTYREHLLPDEAIIKGEGVFRPDWNEVQVSVLDTVLKMRDMKIGDVIRFNIQGVPLEARISSIRTRTKISIQPFFYFVFPPDVLKEAPQTIFTAVRVSRDEIPAIQDRIADRFPNVSVIDMTEVASIFSRVMGRLSAITRFFTLFSITAGVLIIISSALATRYARIQEAVYFKILGAKKGFILKVFALENMAMGLISGSLAVLFSQAASWIVCRKVLDVPYHLFMGPSILMILAAILLVTITGVAASLPVLRQRPVVFLREETRE